MRKLLIVLTMSCIAWAATAGDVAARVEYIRGQYAARLALMQNQPFDDVKTEQLTTEYARMYPGTGLARFSTTYYWTDDENEDYMLKPTLYFVTSHYTMCHGNYVFNREYLFDSETEEPLFMFVSTQMGDDATTRKEYRIYFDDGKVIKQVPERIVIGDDEPLVPDIVVDDAGHVVVAQLLGEMEGLKAGFHRQVPTYPW